LDVLGLEETDGVGEPGAEVGGEELEADGGEEVDGEAGVLGVVPGEETSKVLLEEGISQTFGEFLLAHGAGEFLKHQLHKDS